MRLYIIILISFMLILGCSEKKQNEESAEKSKTGIEQPDKSSSNPDILINTTAPHVIPEDQYVTTPDGLKYADIKVGTGQEPQKGQTVIVHYTGWLVNGKRFDSSLTRGKPYEFQIGQGEVIRGWDEGISTMKVGGVRQLIIPPQLAYGERGAAGVIPPGATLVFEVQLLQVK